MSSNPIKKVAYLGLISVLCWSCATKDDRLFEEKKQEDLVEVFKLEETNFDKFKVVEIPSQETAKKEVEEKKEVAPPVKKVAKAPQAKKTKTEVAKTQEVRKEVVTTSSHPKYPKDYPEEFKKYDKKYKKTWDLFKTKFFKDEEFTFAVKYLGITAGHIKIETKGKVQVAGEEAYHFKASMKSAKFYEYIYSLEDTLESYISADTFLPLKYTLTQRESGQNVDDLQLFDHEKLETYFWYKRLKKGVETKKELKTFIPHYFQDSFSALYFVRGLPLKVGDKYSFPIITRGKVWILSMEVDKVDNIKVMDKWVDALKIKAETHFPGVLKKSGDINFWYSAGDTKRLLKFEAKVKIGSIEGELIEYKEGSNE